MVDRDTDGESTIRRWIAVQRSTSEDTENKEKKNQGTSDHLKETSKQIRGTSPRTESTDDSIRLVGYSPSSSPRSSPRRGEDTDAVPGRPNLLQFKYPALPTLRKSHSHLDPRNSLTAHIEQQRSAAMSSYIKFVNSFTVNGTPFAPTPRRLEPRRVEVSPAGHVTYRDMELLAILCVEQHNLPGRVVDELCDSETGD